MSELKPCEAIEILECIYPSKKQIVAGEYPEVAEALDMAIAALRRAHPGNEPLTLDELRGMKESKDPVWMGRSKQWIFVASVADAPYAQVWYFTAKGMADTVLYHHEAFYRRKPERSEG